MEEACVQLAYIALSAKGRDEVLAHLLILLQRYTLSSHSHRLFLTDPELDMQKYVQKQ